MKQTNHSRRPATALNKVGGVRGKAKAEAVRFSAGHTLFSFFFLAHPLANTVETYKSKEASAFSVDPARSEPFIRSHRSIWLPFALPSTWTDCVLRSSPRVVAGV